MTIPLQDLLVEKAKVEERCIRELLKVAGVDVQGLVTQEALVQCQKELQEKGYSIEQYLLAGERSATVLERSEIRLLHRGERCVGYRIEVLLHREDLKIEVKATPLLLTL